MVVDKTSDSQMPADTRPGRLRSAELLNRERDGGRAGAARQRGDREREAVAGRVADGQDRIDGRRRDQRWVSTLDMTDPGGRTMDSPPP